MNKDAVAEMSQQYQVETARQLVPEGYKQTEVGVIPNDWQSCLASDVVNFFAGYSFSSKSAQSSGVKWLKIANVGLNKVKWDAESYLPYEFSKIHENYLLKPQDIVIALTRPLLGSNLKVAKLELEDSPALLNQRVARLDSLDENNKEFMYYIVQRLDFISAMNLAMAGTDPPNIGVKALGCICVPVPPPKEQAAIANALSDTDALLSELEKLIAKKQAIKTATMQQLLTGRTRLPQFAHHSDGSKKGYKQSELGEIPEDWEVVALKEIAQVKGGKRLPKGELLTKTPTESPYIRVTDMYKGGVDLKDLHYVPAHIAPLINNYRIFAGELFISVAGTLGIVGQLPNSLDGANLTENANRICSIKADIGFIQYSLFSKRIQDEITSQSTVGAQPKLALGRIENFLISLPAKKQEQTAIATILADMDEEIQALEHRLNKTREIKQGMMQELLTGKIRLVKPINEESEYD